MTDFFFFWPIWEYRFSGWLTISIEMVFLGGHTYTVLSTVYHTVLYSCHSTFLQKKTSVFNRLRLTYCSHTDWYIHGKLILEKSGCPMHVRNLIHVSFLSTSSHLCQKDFENKIQFKKCKTSTTNYGHDLMDFGPNKLRNEYANNINK